ELEATGADIDHQEAVIGDGARDAEREQAVAEDRDPAAGLVGDPEGHPVERRAVPRPRPGTSIEGPDDVDERRRAKGRPPDEGVTLRAQVEPLAGATAARVHVRGLALQLE